MAKKVPAWKAGADAREKEKAALGAKASDGVKTTSVLTLNSDPNSDFDSESNNPNPEANDRQKAPPGFPPFVVSALSILILLLIVPHLPGSC